MVSDLACDQGQSVQAGVQWGEVHRDQLVHLDGTSRHWTQHGLTLEGENTFGEG